jgi:DNA polymerase I-like protein with 3'-5' exonuclease and polymerase domains/uracil-DNA glycosylase
MTAATATTKSVKRKPKPATAAPVPDPGPPGEERLVNYAPVEDLDPSRLEYELFNPSVVNLPDAGTRRGRQAPWLPGHYLDEPRAGDGRGPLYPARLMIVVVNPRPRDVAVGRYLADGYGEVLRQAFRDRGVDLAGAYVTGGVKFPDPEPDMDYLPAAWTKPCLWHLLEELIRVQPEYVLFCGIRPFQQIMGAKAKLYTYRSVVTRWRGLNLTVTADVQALARNPATIEGFRADIRMLAHLLRGGEAAKPPAHYHYLRSEDELRPAVEYCQGFRDLALDCEWSGESPRRGGRLLTVQFGVRPGESFVAILWSKTGGYGFRPGQTAAVRLLRDLLCRPGVRLIGQNLRSDLHWLEDLGVSVAGAFAAGGFDTMLASHLLAEEDDHDLMALTLRHTELGRYDYQAQLLLDQGLTHADLPDEVLHPYAAADADALMRVYPELWRRLRADHERVCRERGIPLERSWAGPDRAGGAYVPSLFNLFRHVVMPATGPILEMEEEGLPVDRDRLQSLVAAFADRQNDLLGDLRRVVGSAEFNPASPRQVQEVLYGRRDDGLLGVPDPGGVRRELRLGLTPVKAAGGRRNRPGESAAIPVKSSSTDAATLAAFAEEGHEFARLMLDYRTVSTMTKTILAEAAPEGEGKASARKGIAACTDPDGRVRTVISQMTETGRYRSARPNLMNLPRAKESVFGRVFGGEKLPPLRSIIRAAEGGVFIEADKQSAELFTLAYIANDKAFKEALAARDAAGNPISFHTAAMVKFFKLEMSPAEATAIMDAGGPEAKRLKALRTGAKAVNFGIPYGRGANSICEEVRREGVDCTPGEAQDWIDGYRDGFPDAWAYLQDCRNRVDEPGWLANPYGRIRHFVRSSDESVMAGQRREATNFPIQSTVADALSLDLIRIQRERDRREMRTRIVLSIHDAVMLWAPHDEIGRAGELLRWAMVDAFGAEVPGIGLRYGVDIEYSERWNEPLDPYRLHELSRGEVDRRPRCAACGGPVAAGDFARREKAGGAKAIMCAGCRA